MEGPPDPDGQPTVAFETIDHAVVDCPEVAAVTCSRSNGKPGSWRGDVTGVVVGETTTIGSGVKLYQGVTLGALSIPRDERGRVIRDTKRHPTVEDGVTIYANATVLGGQTVIGRDAVVGGSVFVTESVPASTRVALLPPEMTLRAKADASDFVI